jgi:hypothetical protein
LKASLACGIRCSRATILGSSGLAADLPGILQQQKRLFL